MEVVARFTNGNMLHKRMLLPMRLEEHCATRGCPLMCLLGQRVDGGQGLLNQCSVNVAVLQCQCHVGVAERLLGGLRLSTYL